MSQAAVPVERPIPIPIRIPIREIIPWAIFIGVLALVALYFISTEEGATALLGANGYVHEFLHDGRHLLAFPCH